MLFFVLISIIIVLIAGLTVLLFVPFYLDAEYIRSAVENITQVKIKYLGFTFTLIPKEKRPKRKKKKETREEQEKEEQKGSLSSLKKKIDTFLEAYEETKEDIFDIIDFMQRKAVVVKQLDFDLKLGLDDAMATGVIFGSVYGVVYNILGILHRRITIHEWNVTITPDFDSERFDLRTQCILKIKNVHIMIIAIKALRIYLKFKK